MIACMNKAKLLKLTPEEIANGDAIFSSAPFQKKGSEEFFTAVRTNKPHRARTLLSLYGRYLVYDYDYARLTPLHWACKRGCYEIA